MRISDLYNNAVCRLKAAKIPDPELEAALMLGHLLNLDRAQLHIVGDRNVAASDADSFEKYLLRRLDREPLAYILGEWEFWSLPFKVNRDVLVPRPETEFLLEKVFQVLKEKNYDLPGRVLDLGCGSGVIAIIMALESPGTTVFGVDISYAALLVAAENASRHKVDQRVHFVNSDWFSCLAPGKVFDLVLTNPPYVPAEMFASENGTTAAYLQPEVELFEPRLALNGGRDGVEVINRFAMHLDRIIKPGGWFFMEIGDGQAEYVLRYFQTLAGYDCLHVYEDYSGIPRVFQCRRNNENRHGKNYH